MSRVLDVRPDRHAARARVGPDPGDRDVNVDFPFHFDGRGRTATTASTTTSATSSSRSCSRCPASASTGRTSAAACSSSPSRRSRTSSRRRPSSRSRAPSSSGSATSSPSSGRVTHERRDARRDRRVRRPAHRRAPRRTASSGQRRERLRYACCDELRGARPCAGHPTLNAIDFLEVDAARTRPSCTLHFVNPLTPQQLAGLARETIEIRGGERIRDIDVEVLSAGGATAVLRATPAGDFSRYELALVRSASDPRPPAGFDPILSTVEFSFKVDCPSRTSTAASPAGPPPRRPRSRTSTTWPRTTRASAG